MLAVLAASVLAVGPLERAQLFFQAYCDLQNRKAPAKEKNARWNKAVIENGTLDFAILVLGDGFSDPIENAQDSYLCLRGGAFKARLLNQTSSAASVMIALGSTGSEDALEVLLINEKQGWRVADTKAVGRSEHELPIPAFSAPADFHLPPRERALPFYEAYLPRAFESGTIYAERRFANFMFDLRGWLTRRYMLKLLTEPHPDHDGKGDSLVCFVPELDEVDGPSDAIPPGSFSVVEAKTNGNSSAVTVQQKKKDGSIAGSATLHFVKQDVWRLDNVSCPKT